jgi:hypothetical protein
LELIDFKYVYCPVMEKELRLKRLYKTRANGTSTRKKVIDCTGALRCGACSVMDEKVIFDFTDCPFRDVNFFD